MFIMTESLSHDVIIISDSEGSDTEKLCSKMKSPLTALKSKPMAASSARKNKTTQKPGSKKQQTKLDNFFQTLTFKTEKSSSLVKDISEPTPLVGGQGKKQTASTKACLVLSPPRASYSVKRAAAKGLSPKPKQSTIRSHLISDLKGEYLSSNFLSDKFHGETFAVSLRQTISLFSSGDGLDSSLLCTTD